MIRRPRPDVGVPGQPPNRSRGAAAIEDHVDQVDGGPEYRSFHPRPSNRFGGPGPVGAVTLHYLASSAHWHLVTCGLSEFHPKEPPDREGSGWGFELTFRIAGEEEDPPLWAVDFLASLAAYVRSSQHPFAVGHNLDLRGPIRMDSDSPITAALIVEDPALGQLAGPFGAVQFLQVVGLTGDELELCRAWSSEGVAELIGRDDPLLVSRLDRASVGDDLRWTEEIRTRTRLEGSSLHELRVGSLRIKRRWVRGATVQMGAGAASALGPALRRELVASGTSFAVFGDDCELIFGVGDEPGWSWSDHSIEMSVPGDEVEAVSALFDGRTGWGGLPAWPGLRFRVVK